MRARRRLLVGPLLVLSVIAVVAPGATAAATADPVPTRFTQFGIVGSGPDDLVLMTAIGLTPGDTATVRMTAGDLSIDLPSLTVGADGTVHNAAGYRTPADLAPGLYRFKVSDESGATATISLVQIKDPAITSSAVADPGTSARLFLTGAGGGPDVGRTVTVDGAPTSFTSFEDLDTRTMGVDVPIASTDLPGATHQVVMSQDRSPAVSLTSTVTVSTPTAGVSQASPEGYFGGRQNVTVGSNHFGPRAELSARLTDAAGLVVDVPGLTSSDVPVPFTLPGLAPGTARVDVVNRVNGAVASSTFRIANSTLTAPQDLGPDGYVLGADGQTRLDLRPDGNLVVSRVYLPKWSSATTGRDGANLVPLPDGSWGLKTRAGAVVWSTRSPTTDRPTRLTAQADGNVVLYSAHGKALWSTRTAGGDLVTLAAGSYLGPNGRLRAGIGDYTATMQTDGTFLIVRGSDARITFRTPTGHNPGAAITLQPDGNLVVYSAAGKALWANGVRSGPGSRLVMQRDGNLVEYSSTGKALWATNTAAR